MATTDAGREATARIRQYHTGATLKEFGPSETEGYEFEGTFAFTNGETQSYLFWHSTLTGNMLSQEAQS